MSKFVKGLRHPGHVWGVVDDVGYLQQCQVRTCNIIRKWDYDKKDYVKVDPKTLAVCPVCFYYISHGSHKH